eukprot:11740318-Alexandrium_andersonii.AAC.1
MSASLVGSEMCIRDRLQAFQRREVEQWRENMARVAGGGWHETLEERGACLLYTSDAADDM